MGQIYVVRYSCSIAEFMTASHIVFKNPRNVYSLGSYGLYTFPNSVPSVKLGVWSNPEGHKD